MPLGIQNQMQWSLSIQLVAKGLIQIPGLDITDNFSPVVNDIIFPVVITQMITEKWDARIVDIDNGILNGELEHEIYMAIPEGYEEWIEQCRDDKSLKLEKAIYSLVQAA